MTNLPKELLALATRKTFRVNPFRILQVPVLADARELRRAELLSRMAEKGINPDSVTDSGCWPLSPPPSPNEIQAAFHALNDPLERFLWEYLWLWPEDYIKKIGFKDEDGLDELIEIHNAAIIQSTLAMDIEYDYDAGNWPEGSASRWSTAWRTSLDRHKILSEDPRLEQVLVQRIRQIDDPRLTTGWGRRLPTYHLQFIGIVVTKYISKEILNGMKVNADAYTEFLTESEMIDYLSREDIIKDFTSIENQINELVLSTKRLNSENPEQSIELFNDFAEKDGKSLQAIVSVLGITDSYCLTIVEKLVDEMFDSSIAFGRKTENWEACLDNIEKAIRPFCITKVMQNRLSSAINQLTELNNSNAWGEILENYTKRISELVAEGESKPLTALNVCFKIHNDQKDTEKLLLDNKCPQKEILSFKEMTGIKITSLIIVYWNASPIETLHVENCTKWLEYVAGWITNDEAKEWHNKNLDGCKLALPAYYRRHSSSPAITTPVANQSTSNQNRTQATSSKSTNTTTTSNSFQNTPKPKKEVELSSIKIWGPIAAIIILVIMASNSNSKTPTYNSNSTRSSPVVPYIPPTATVEVPTYTPPPPPVRSFPAHGTTKFFVEEERIARLKINTPENILYFVKLEDAYTGQRVAKFFIRGGNPFEIKVPLGNYVMKYAAGSIWYGEKIKFGPQTVAKKMEAILDFKIQGNYVSGHEIWFRLAANGNLKSTDINPDDI